MTQDFDTDQFAELLRKAAAGKTISIYQLLKGGKDQGAERPIELTPNLRWYRLGLERCVTDHFNNEDRQAVRKLWRHAQRDQSQVVYLDGLAGAIELGIISQREVDRYIADRASLLTN